MSNYKIKQLLPASDWLAAYILDKEPYFELRHIIGFAVLDGESGFTGMDGVSGDLKMCIGSCIIDPIYGRQYPYFSQFIHKDEITEDFKKEIVRIAKESIPKK